MVRVVNCHGGVLGSNPGRHRIFSPWNYFTGGSGNSVAPESASGSCSGLLMSGSQEIAIPLLSHMVRGVNCHAEVLGSNPGGPRIFSPL